MLSKYSGSKDQLKLKNKRLNISIAMCTFNGADYLYEQLDSIAKQTRLPDELVVCDDISTDSTLQILNEFQENAPFQIRIYHNDKKLGSTKNFEKAINLCKGDIIVLSDQDDVWLPQKIEKLEYIFKSNPDIGYVFSDANVVDEKLFPLGYTLWERINFNVKQHNIFKQSNQVRILLKHNIVTGATMAIRADIRDWILPIPAQWIHDAWIALLVSAAGLKGFFIEEPLIKYRQHSTQLIGGKRLTLSEQIQKTYDKKSDYYNDSEQNFKYILERLILKNNLQRDIEKLFKMKIEHLHKRHMIHKYNHWKRIRLIFMELKSGNYHRFSNGWKSIARDLYL